MRRGGGAWALAFAGGLLLAVPPAAGQTVVEAPAASAPAAERIRVRVGNHPGFGRVVFDWPAPPAYAVEQLGEDRVRLRFDAAGTVDVPRSLRPPRNVLGITATAGGVEITMRPGARLRHFLHGPKVVVDLRDPAAAPPPESARADPRVPRPAPAAREAAGASAARTSGRGGGSADAAPAPPAGGDQVARARADRGGGQSAPPERPAAREQQARARAATAPSAVPGGAAAEAAAPVPGAGATEGAAPTSASADASASPAPPPPPVPPSDAPAGAPSMARPAAAASPAASATTPASVPVSPAARPPGSAADADAPRAGAATPPAAPAAASSATPPAAAGGVATAPIRVPRPVAPMARAADVPATPPAAGARTVRLVALPGGSRGALVPFGPETGVALLRRGDVVMAVFDTAQPLDLAPLRRDPVLSGMTAATLPGATQMTIALAPPAVLRARRIDGAWLLQAVQPAAADAPPRPIVIEPVQGAAVGERQMLLRATMPGRVVTLADPVTGLPLLVGTLREPGEAQLQAIRMAEADLPATAQGAAVVARSDRVALRATPDGFLLLAPGEGARPSRGTALAAADGAATQPMTRLFDIPGLPAADLIGRLRAEQAAIGAAPPLARRALRRSAAETLLALGLPQEAQALLALARAEDPEAASDPVLGALAGAAAVLAGRPAEAAGLDDPRLPDRDEVILWRAALAAARGRTEGVAEGFAATIPLALAYPPGLRRRLLPLLAEAAAGSGDAAALGRIAAASGDRPELALVRAAHAEAEGKVEEALAGYDAVSEGRDRRARARALRRAIDLRLAHGMLDAGTAAKALEATLFAWRGDGQEAATRMRIAALRQQAGDARGALGLLRETEQLFPDEAESLQRPIQEAFIAALEHEPPLSAIALFDAFPALLPKDARGATIVGMLADRLLALDLPDRATTLLSRAAEQAPAGVERATLGLRLAALRLAAGDGAAALVALAATAAAPLPEALARDRVVLAARAEARRGEMGRAVEALRGLGPDGAEPLGELLTEARDWRGAAAAYDAHLRRSLPAPPAPLDESHRRALLRQAALLAMAGDQQGSAALREAFGPRMPDGALAEAFAALTTDPLRGLADLPRLQRELQLFRRLPGGLEPLRAAKLGTR